MQTSDLRFQDLSSSAADEFDTWLIYGNKDTVDKYMSLYQEQKEQVGQVATITCPPHDYTCWHNMVAVTMESGDTVTCWYSDKNLAAPPGTIHVMGPEQEVKELVERLRDIMNSSGSEEMVRNSPLFVSVEPPSFEELKLFEYFPFPNVRTAVDTNERVLNIFGKSINAASVVLAKKYYETLMGKFGKESFELMRRQYRYLVEHRKSVIPELNRYYF